LLRPCTKRQRRSCVWFGGTRHSVPSSKNDRRNHPASLYSSHRPSSPCDSSRYGGIPFPLARESKLSPRRTTASNATPAGRSNQSSSRRSLRKSRAQRAIDEGSGNGRAKCSPARQQPILQPRQHGQRQPPRIEVARPRHGQTCIGASYILIVSLLILYFRHGQDHGVGRTEASHAAKRGIRRSLQGLRSPFRESETGRHKPPRIQDAVERRSPREHPERRSRESQAIPGAASAQAIKKLEKK
jgi:hypothetical protein